MDAPDGLVITTTDVRRAGYCVGPAMRHWFEGHGLDFRDFIKNGAPAAKILATGDAMADRVVATAMRRARG